jgi:TetR/AcrR family acrAB operon transcriptional repressor
VRRTKEQAAETGCQILLAAESLFLEKGYDEVSLEEIAVAAGVTRGAIHWHFKNKHGLLLALRDGAQEPFRQLADDLSVSDGAASLRMLEDIFMDLFERLENDPRQRGLVRVMTRLDIAIAERDENARAMFPHELHDAFVRILQAVDRDLGLRPPWTPEKAAKMLYAITTGLLVEWSLRRGALEIYPDGGLVLSTFFAGLTVMPIAAG